MKKNLVFLALAMWGATSFAQSAGTATLNWTYTSAQNIADKASGAATSFNIYRANAACPADGSAPAGMALITNVPITAVTYVDSGLGVGSFCYYIKTNGPNGESVATNTAGKSIFGAPSAPGTLNVK